MPVQLTEEQKAMLHLLIEEQWLSTFPRRVWEQSSDGKWASREPTPDEEKQRRDWAKHMTQKTLKRYENKAAR